MSRVINKKSIHAFIDGYKLKVSNTEVKIINDEAHMRLFNNLIAINHLKSDFIEITMAGYDTVTTKSRLNMIPGVSIHTSKGQTYLNGNPMDSNKMYRINKF
jgi:hypothetical protein